MIYTLQIALKSLINRRFTTSLTVLSIALSVALLIGVERIRDGARESFSNTISQTDLIVGSKGGTIQLLLYAVFRMGSATGNLSWEAFQKYSKHPAVEWTIPYSLGDSHRGFRVVGTNSSFYEHYRYRGDRQIELASGIAGQGLFDVVLGSDVASNAGYKVGDRVVVSHGVATEAILKHDTMPFKVVGILKRTATPIDRSVYITLEGMEAIHMDWGDGAPPRRGEETRPESVQKEKIEIGQITAFLLRTKNRVETLRLQREINDDPSEPLMAIIPGVALNELWLGLSYAEDALRVVSVLVILVGLLGMLVSLYNSLNERRREMAILRAVGAGPGMILTLMVFESTLLTTIGTAVGVVMTYGTLFALNPLIESHFGLYVPINFLTGAEMLYLALVIGCGIALGVIPAWRAYRNTLADGLTIRV